VVKEGFEELPPRVAQLPQQAAVLQQVVALQQEVPRQVVVVQVHSRVVIQRLTTQERSKM